MTRTIEKEGLALSTRKEVVVEQKIQFPLRLLLVDGHEAVRDALLDRLSRLSLVGSIAAAGSLPAALAFLREFRPDVVFCDPRNLEGDPGEIVLQICEVTGPVVVLTSSLRDGEPAAFRAAGAAAVLLKGTDLAAFLADFAQSRPSPSGW
jgi:DNA-binding NarL/FixJ family response regulator